jgi:DNA-directed RNA polymerase specialized sigma24 family protein
MQDPDGDDAAPASSLSPAIAEALLILDTRYMRATSNDRGVRITTLERIDRARDELLRRPDREGDPEQLVSNAWGNAGKVIRNRITLLAGPRDGEVDEIAAEKRADRIATLQQRFGERDDDSVATLALEIRDVVARASLPQRDKRIMELLMLGMQSNEIAGTCGVPRPVAQVWISRARGRAHTAWIAA